MQKLAPTFQWKVLKLAKEGESFLQLQQGEGRLASSIACAMVSSGTLL
jgi:hypothetical protein